MPSRKQQARRKADFVTNVKESSRRIDRTFESKARTADMLDSQADYGREHNGQYMRQGDKARLKTAARQVRKDASLRGNDYEYASKEDVKKQHSATYRNVRRSFGLSAG